MNFTSALNHYANPSVLPNQWCSTDAYGVKNKNIFTDSKLIFRDSIPTYSNYRAGRVITEPVGAEDYTNLERSIKNSKENDRKSSLPNNENIKTSQNMLISNGERQCSKLDPATRCNLVDRIATVPNPNVRPVNTVEPISTSHKWIETRTLATHSQCKAQTIMGLQLDLPLSGINSGVRFITYNEWDDIHSRGKCLQRENDDYRTQLNRQHQVNAELKKLLVASLGDDLQERVNKLARDRINLSVELKHLSEKTTKDQETIDKISIQADMWRSKFLASQMMGEEWAKNKAFYTVMYQESQNALYGLLNERHKLRASLLQSKLNLELIQEALDPFKNQLSLAPLNSQDLASQTLQLSQILKFRLLPPSNSLPLTSLPENHLTDQLSHAESFAHEVISRHIDISDLNSLLSPSMHQLSYAPLTIARYHPDVKYDNLTYDCCARCHGDIQIL